jgi:3'-phosphoadenosine 5'-phosphosulfate sulfotransferase (PAPS reductase)/FAD synthetase
MNFATAKYDRTLALVFSYSADSQVLLLLVNAAKNPKTNFK